MRRKPWARPELAACPYFFDEAVTRQGTWRSLFQKSQPLYLELGMGKGAFIAQAAAAHPEINYMGVDIKSDVIGVARRRVESEFEAVNRTPDNIIMTAFDITRLPTVMNEQDKVDRIYINFCNPWPTGAHHKKRLTHTRQLMNYRNILAEGGEIHFKTDDDPLFNSSLRYFAEAGFEVIHMTRDLHANPTPDNYVTEHEIMFSEQGIPIKFCIAKMVALPEMPAEAEETTENE
jgi:tRNA (guanine-N7-)-methyltransferase